MSVELTTRYMGLTLRNPIVVSSCPLTGMLESIKRLADAGAGALVLPSLFEEQIEHEEMEIHHFYEAMGESPDAVSFFPELEDYNTGPDRYLMRIDEAKQVAGIPIIASLNGTVRGDWIRYARLIEEAGADALELNIYFVPTDADCSAADVEQRYYDLVAAVREGVKIPVAVKLGPYFSNLTYVARHLAEQGADALVLFNRYLAPDIDVESLAVEPRVVLSQRSELWLSLRWLSILRDQLSISLAATSGVHEAEDVIKCLLTGADVAMVATSVMRQGTAHVATLVQGLESWLEEHDYQSVEQIKGSLSMKNAPDASAFARSNYMEALVRYATDSQ